MAISDEPEESLSQNEVFESDCISAIGSSTGPTEDEKKLKSHVNSHVNSQLNSQLKSHVNSHGWLRGPSHLHIYLSHIPMRP
jgi:hypothetical protein